MDYESFRETTCVTLSVCAISERLVSFFRKQFGRHRVILVGYISFGKQEFCYKFIFVVCVKY